MTTSTRTKLFGIFFGAFTFASTLAITPAVVRFLSGATDPVQPIEGWIQNVGLVLMPVIGITFTILTFTSWWAGSRPTPTDNKGPTP